MKSIMKNRKILVILVIFSILIEMPIIAQSHEFSACLGSGLSTLRYKLSDGDRTGRMGMDFGLGYTYHFQSERITGTGDVNRQHWGIHTGIGLGLYNAKTKLNDVETVTKLNDNEPVFSDFDLHTTLSKYIEKQNTTYLNIPAMALFQFDQFYAMGGFKFGIPLNQKYMYKDATLTNKAYYPELENYIIDKKDRGIGVFQGEDFKNNLELGIAVMLSLEGGVTWKMNSNFTLFTGLYFDYGLNNLAKGNRKDFINYNLEKPADFTTNSVLSSFTDKTKIMAIGIIIRVAMKK